MAGVTKPVRCHVVWSDGADGWGTRLSLIVKHKRLLITPRPGPTVVTIITRSEPVVHKALPFVVPSTEK